MRGSLKNDCFSIWRTKYERQMSGNSFKPLFVRYIGVENKDNYNDILKTFSAKFEEHKDKTLIFDGLIEMSGEFELIDYINRELATMNIYDMTSQDITLFDNVEVNQVFLKALDYVIPLAIQNENFFNESVRNNFITKLIVWGYCHLKHINFNGDINPKCLHYGKIQRHEIYFLMVLHLMSFDVIYLNPLKEEYWGEIDKDNISELRKDMQILEVETFADRIKKGSIIELTESITKQLKRDIEKELFTDTGIFRDWQFRDGYTKSLFMDTLIEDLMVTWQEPAKLRPGFNVNGNVVTVPCFFQKIDGEYTDSTKYAELVNMCVNAPNTLLINDCRLSSDIPVSDNMYELMFCQLSDGTFDIEEIKKASIYKYGKYSEEVQNFILKKFNETILDKNLYAFNLTIDNMLQLLVLVLHMNESIIRLIDNFDFPNKVPKIVIYLNNEDALSDNMLLLLGYLHKMGLDIVIFNPSGMFNITKIIKSNRVNNIRLQEMKYDSQYNSIKNNFKVKKKNFLDRFFK